MKNSVTFIWIITFILIIMKFSWFIPKWTWISLMIKVTLWIWWVQEPDVTGGLGALMTFSLWNWAGKPGLWNQTNLKLNWEKCHKNYVILVSYLRSSSSSKTENRYLLYRVVKRNKTMYWSIWHIILHEH